MQLQILFSVILNLKTSLPGQIFYSVQYFQFKVMGGVLTGHDLIAMVKK